MRFMGAFRKGKRAFQKLSAVNCSEEIPGYYLMISETNKVQIGTNRRKHKQENMTAQKRNAKNGVF